MSMAVTIKELVKEQEWNDLSDIWIIKTFFTRNNMEEEGIELITELSKSKISKLKQKEENVEMWTSYLPSKYLYENYDLEMADMLHTLELDFLSHGGKLSNARLKWAKENLSNIKMPKVYFQPLVKWLKEQGIEFQK